MGVDLTLYIDMHQIGETTPQQELRGFYHGC